MNLEQQTMNSPLHNEFHLQAKKAWLAFALLASTFCLPSSVNASQALANSKNCMTCHTVDKKLVGPSFREIAGRYKNQAAASELLAGKIVKGGSGVWGPVPMPAQSQVSTQEAISLASWILEQR